MPTFPAGLISNLALIEDKRYFSAIIGKSPSKGARSPRLWNAAYQAIGIDAQMYPLDVEPENVESLIYHLQSNPYFLGGCVAFPYKENISNILSDRLTPEASAIGAVNSLFRNSEGHLCGTNTDGEAALKSLIAKNGSIKDKRVLILGGGGAGKSLCPHISNAVGVNGSVLLACRNSFPPEMKQKALGITSVIKWEDLSIIAKDIDILINCTSVGAADNRNASPLSLADLKCFKRLSFVYDIIYDPQETMLLNLASELGLGTLNGLTMNLEQAVLAFGYAQPDNYKKQSCDKIRSIMLQA